MVDPKLGVGDLTSRMQGLSQTWDEAVGLEVEAVVALVL